MRRAEIAPLQSSLGNKSETPFQKKKKSASSNNAAEFRVLKNVDSLVVSIFYIISVEISILLKQTFFSRIEIFLHYLGPFSYYEKQFLLERQVKVFFVLFFFF